jgi:hypothetical protein
MYDGIFFINHALSVNQLSVFSNEERFEQTLETLKSIDKYCPNNLKIIFDSSPNQVEDSYLRTIADWNNTWFLDMGKHQYVQMYSLNGYRSLAETYSFMGVLGWFREQKFEAKRIYKLSGRYSLNDNFILDDPSYKDAFVFAEALESWMDDNIKKTVEVHSLYRLRLWHMDYSLLDTFTKELPRIFEDCGQYNIDVEHSYYKHLHKYKVVEVPKIGVQGYIAPSGEYINE